MSVLLIGMLLLPQGSGEDVSLSGTVAEVIRSGVARGLLPEGSTASGVLRSVPIAVRCRVDGTANLRSVLVEALDAEWQEQGNRLVLSPTPNRKDRLAHETQLLSASAAEQLERLPKSAFESPNATDLAATEVMSHIVVARESGWNSMPKLALSGATTAVVKRLGGEFFGRLRGDRPVYLATKPSGLAEALPSRCLPILDAYFRVQKDRKVQNSLSESMENLEGWFGPTKIDPRGAANVVLFTFSRSVTDVIVSSAAYGEDGQLVDRASATVPIPRPQSIQVADAPWQAIERRDFRWSEDAQLLLESWPNGPAQSELPAESALRLGRIVAKDPLPLLASEIAAEIPLTDSRSAVAVVPADSWLESASPTVGRPMNLGILFRTLGKAYGISVRDGATLVIGSGLPESAERDRADRAHLATFRSALRKERLPELHAYLAFEGSTGRASLSYPRGTLQALRRAAQTAMRVTGSYQANAWLGSLSYASFARIASDDGLVGSFSDPNRILQSACDAWSPWQSEAALGGDPPLNWRCALWNPARFLAQTGVRLEPVARRLYVREQEAPYLDLAQTPSDFAEYLRQNLEAGIFTKESLQNLRVREAASQEVSLIWARSAVNRISIPIAGWRNWNGDVRPLGDFPEVSQQVKGIG